MLPFTGLVTSQEDTVSSRRAQVGSLHTCAGSSEVSQDWTNDNVMELRNSVGLPVGNNMIQLQD